MTAATQRALRLQVRMAILGASLVAANAVFVGLSLELLTFVPGWAIRALELPAVAGSVGLARPEQVHGVGEALRGAALASALASLADGRPEEDYRRAASLRGLWLLPDGFGATETGPFATYLAEDRPTVRAAHELVPVGVVAHPDTETRVDRLRGMIDG